MPQPQDNFQSMASAGLTPRVQSGTLDGRYRYHEIKVGSKTGETLLAFDERTRQAVVIKPPTPHPPTPQPRRAALVFFDR